ncbi:unnamed protein product [Cyclocybe aegerita]|uniref:DUF1766-domain-containing protein n=1 Tax=Cyclocybe aegerita TaxID=1973307 RepID=A0A8S0X2L5_CYCAE|nr:unnamed protein product [Cyclocybe aegerita]
MASNYAKEKAKRMAENFLAKLVDSFDSQKEDKPPKPPPKPAEAGVSGSSDHAASAQQDISSVFDNLSISNQPNPPPPNPHFVGGFNPSYSVVPTPYAPAAPSPTGTHPSSSAPNLVRPVAMPTPFVEFPGQQSLTMQMALLPPGAPTPATRPHSNPVISSSKPPLSPSSKPPKPSPAKPASPPSTPAKASKVESISAASTPGKPGQEQCAGVTKAGKRCTRMVKLRPAFASLDSDDSGTMPRFCHQHSKELLGPSGFYARKNGEWVEFDAWIPSYLQPETRVSLRVEMERSRSSSDVHGYIYTFEIRETTETETIKLKVGRAVNLVKRIDQWGKQCGSKEQVLRGFYPGSVEPDEDGGEGSLMKGRVKAGEKAAWCHRLERLIHIELADLVSTYIYLDPAWPNVDEAASTSAGEKTSNSKDSNIPRTCPDCGSIHKEIFEFQRWKRGKNKGKEWGNLVKPVVERWGKFVELYV